MKGFLKAFFGSLLALVVFCVLLFFFFAGMIGSLVKTEERVKIHNNSVLVMELNTPIREQPYMNPFNALLRDGKFKIQGLHELVRGIERAQTDPSIRGIYLKLNGAPNGYATNEALRRALLKFKQSGKFIVAYGDVISQKDYYLASVADKVYLNPEGILDFSGFSMKMIFFKNAMDKLDIEAQIFYDGKYKSATEPFRTTEMTAANKTQTRAYLNSLYDHFLNGISEQRHIDTAVLFEYANKGLVQSANDAKEYGLVDGLKYKDEVIKLLHQKMGVPAGNDLDFVSLPDYSVAKRALQFNANSKIAVLYAQGNIINESIEGATPNIAAEKYVKLFERIREDSSIKGVVFRINSPGGSALASDKIWRAVMLTKQIKPVVVSMGDYAASGGYYIACAADSIFTEANTLTGSIGVFGIIPNLQRFFKNKLGITFDGVKTARYADMGSPVRPLTAGERAMIQNSVDEVYRTFKERVSKGRELAETVVDSIAQGRVWSGAAAVKIGLADTVGGMPAAISCAARMAGLSDYSLEEYPKPELPYKQALQTLTGQVRATVVQQELGKYFPVFQQLKEVTRAKGEVMARLPFVFYSY